MKLSACWIVRNKAEHFTESIQSLKQCVEELIVVDIGASDDSIDIAKSYGARIERFRWTGDISAAKNYALSLASGEYVIFLNTDEYFNPALRARDQSVILNMFEMTKADVLEIPVLEEDLETGTTLKNEPCGRIVSRKTIHFENKVYEVQKLANGEIPQRFTVDEYYIVRRGCSAAAKTDEAKEHIEILESEQSNISDKSRLFAIKAELLSEYLLLGNYEKAFENCRYIMDHDDEWGAVCKLYSYSFIQRIYDAIKLASMKRLWFSRKEVYRKLFLSLKENYPDARETVLHDLYYQMIFDYREDRFQRVLLSIEKTLAVSPPGVTKETRQVEAAIYGQGAVAAFYRGDTEKVYRWAKKAFKLAPELKLSEIMQALMEGRAPKEIHTDLRDLILRGEYHKAYEIIIEALNSGSLDHMILECLLIIAEKGAQELTPMAKVRFETGMSMLNEAIELGDMLNTGFACKEEIEREQEGIKEITPELFLQGYENDKDRMIPADLLVLHDMAAPVYEKKGLSVSAMCSYRLLLVKGNEPDKQLKNLAKLFNKYNNEQCMMGVEALIQ